jgi:hypothetical protein
MYVILTMKQLEPRSIFTPNSILNKQHKFLVVNVDYGTGGQIGKQTVAIIWILLCVQK